jgi:hypothetical protein
MHCLEASAGAWSNAQDAKLARLLHSQGCNNNSNFKERYDLSLFALGHIKFKRLHNKAFNALAGYCQSK